MKSEWKNYADGNIVTLPATFGELLITPSFVCLSVWMFVCLLVEQLRIIHVDFHEIWEIGVS